MRLKTSVFLIPLLAALVPGSGSAAMNARVTLESARIHDTPDSFSTVLMEVTQGQVLRVSSEHKKGWYRVLVPESAAAEPYYGWIRESSIEPDELGDELRAAGIQSYVHPGRRGDRHRFVLSGLFGYAYSSPVQLQKAAGDSNSLFTHTVFGGEIGYRITTTWTLGGFASVLNVSRLIEDGSYFVKTMLMGLYLERTTRHSLPFKLGWALGLGAAMNSTVGMTTSEAALESDPFMAPTAFLKITARWYPVENVALMTTLGGRYLSSQFGKPGGITLGSESFQLDLHGAFAEGGIQLEF